MVFSVVVYSGDKIFDAETQVKSVGSDDVEFKVTASLPSLTEDCYVTAFLWDNYINMNSICDSSVFPTGSTLLRSVKIDGVPVAGFNSRTVNYNHPIDLFL